MITNAVVVQIIALTLLATSLLGGIRIGVEYQALSHSAENLSIELARKTFDQNDVSVRDICLSAHLAKDQHLTRCEVTANEVKIHLSKPISWLGKTFLLGADSRVGFGFYSQNSP